MDRFAEEYRKETWMKITHISTGPNQKRLEDELTARQLPEYKLMANKYAWNVDPNRDTPYVMYELSLGDIYADNKYICLASRESTEEPNYDANPTIEALAKRALLWLWSTYPCPELALYRLESRMTQLEQKVDRLLAARSLCD